MEINFNLFIKFNYIVKKENINPENFYTNFLVNCNPENIGIYNLVRLNNNLF